MAALQLKLKIRTNLFLRKIEQKFKKLKITDSFPRLHCFQFDHSVFETKLRLFIHERTVLCPSCELSTEILTAFAIIILDH